jgi:dTDP-glucose 4,6-dehydratase
MNLLVTGGAGFIGSNYIEQISKSTRWDRIFILDALTYAGNKSNLTGSLSDSRLQFIHGDIRNPELVDEIMKQVDTVVHFAAESHVDRSILNPNEFVSTNVLGTNCLLNSAMHNEISKFVHISTDEIYGSIDEGSWTEASPLEPNSPYSASKASSDLIALSYFKTYGFPVVVTRCSNNYGKYQFPEKLIPLAITNLIEGKSIPIYGDGLILS